MRSPTPWLAALALAAAGPAMAAVPGDVAAPAVPPVAWPAGPGKVLVETRCLLCHQGELIAAQRLTPAQWTKEVDKMVRWGAPLADAEKAVLAAYLAKHYAADAPAYVPRRATLPAAGR